MKNINLERGLVRIAWTLSILMGTVGLLFLLAFSGADELALFAIYIMLVPFQPTLVGPGIRFALVILAVGLVLFFIRGFCVGNLKSEVTINSVEHRKITKRIIISAIVVIVNIIILVSLIVISKPWSLFFGIPS